MAPTFKLIALVLQFNAFAMVLGTVLLDHNALTEGPHFQPGGISDQRTRIICCGVVSRRAARCLCCSGEQDGPVVEPDLVCG